MRAKQFLRNNFWYLLGLVILGWVIWVNSFPWGYVIAGDEAVQFINLQKNFSQIFFEWSGQLSLFYAIFYLLAKAGVSDSGQLFWYLGIFLAGSYLSFDLFLRLIFKNTTGVIRFLTALFYALNIFTLAVFSGTAGFSPYFLLYIFLPALTGLYLKFLQEQKIIFGAFFILALFLASVGFGNPAFALAFALFLFFLTILSGFFGYCRFSKKFLIKFAIFILFVLLICASWLFPSIVQVNANLNNFPNEKLFSPYAREQFDANSILSILRLVHYRANSFFPYNFPYASLKIFKNLFVALTYLPIGFILLALWQKKEQVKRRLFWLFFTLLLIFSVLVAKTIYPLEKISALFFQLPGFGMLGGYDKLAILMPFLVAIILFFALAQSAGKRYYHGVLILFGALLLAPLPFYAGKIQQKVSGAYAKEKQANYQSAKRAYLVKIPQEYFRVQKIINQDLSEGKVAVLPYSLDGELGQANYVKWKLRGEDITKMLYQREAIDPNNFYFNQWLFAADFNQSDYDPQWLVKLLGMMHARYILYHKDVEEKFIDASLAKIEYLEKEKLILPLEKNDYFNLYELQNDWLFPQVAWLEENVSLGQNPFTVDVLFAGVKEQVRKADYLAKNPKEFSVTVERNVKNSRYLVLNEPYDENWSAYWQNNGQRVKLEHNVSLGYANGWLVKKNMAGGKIVIEYRPLRLFFWGAGFSIFALIAVLSYIGYYLYNSMSSPFRKFIP